VYARLEDLGGVLDCLVMKARLARCRGDEDSAVQADALYAQVLADQEAPEGFA